MRLAAALPICLLFAVDCGSRADPQWARHFPTASSDAPPPTAPTCARAGAYAVPLPVDDSAGGAVAIARLGEQTIAYVADDDASLRTIDLDSKREIALTTLDGAPSAIAVLSDGRVAVTLRDRGEIAVLEPREDPAAPLAKRCAIGVATEPTGIATTPDGSALLVVSRWGHALAVFDAATLERRFELDLPRDPRAVVASSDGRRAFVSHVAGGRISVVDLDETHALRPISLDTTERFIVQHMPDGRETDRDSSSIDVRRRRAGQGYSILRGPGGRILAPQVFTDPGNGISSGSGGYGDDVTVLGDVAPIEERSERRTSDFHTARLGPLDCLLPRAAALDARTGRLLVACFGLDRVVVYDAKAKSPHDHELGRIKVGSGPSGIAIDDKGRRAVVWSAFDQSLSSIDLDAPLHGKGATLPSSIALERRSPPLDADVARGRVLFHAAGDRRIASDGRACSSCHPDGRDDSITWTTPNGQRQTPMLIERLEGTAPYGWDGAGATELAHLGRTLVRLSGTGLPLMDKRALFAYVDSLRAPASRSEASSVALRGAELFHAEITGCASCHLGDDVLTDRLRHDVKSHIASDFSVTAFDTPSLRFVGHSAPYFHDGRYATLEELLRRVDGTMGHTALLTPDDRAALEAYLDVL